MPQFSYYLFSIFNYFFFSDGEPSVADNAADWTDTQINAWQRAGWSSGRSEVSSQTDRDTPPAFDDVSEEEEAELRPELRRNDPQNDGVNERIVSLFEELIERQESLYNELFIRQDNFFTELNNRMDTRFHELQGNIQQTIETHLRCIQTQMSENYTTVHEVLQSQLRERTLIVQLLCAINGRLQQR